MYLDILYEKAPQEVKDWLKKELNRPGMFFGCSNKEFKEFHFLTPHKFTPYKIRVYIKAEDLKK